MAAENSTMKNIDSFIITGFDHLQNQKLLGSLILITYILILLGNGINLCIILADKHLYKPMYILMCNLAVVDIIYTSTCSTTMISVLLAEDKTVSYYSCISRMFFYHLGDYTICLALTLMAIDRLIAIKLPLRYHSIVTNSQTLLFIVLTWIIAIAIMGVLTSIIDNAPYCQPIIKYVFCDYPSMIRAACVNPEPYFFLPAMINLWFFCGLLPFVICTYAVLAYSVTKLSNSSRKQMINTCLSHLIVLFSFYAPKLVSYLLTRIGVVLTLTERNAILIISSLLPALINPVVYCTRTKEIRKRLADVFLHKKVVPGQFKVIS
ncbi:odorant receptor 106-3 [Danio rerio]|uniref:Odorant receptor n=1 Tax=Danio rerio TaxID=7955 RepID=Q2PRL4_DANRE|nr:odorant receptor 106-3 [Danio rerio]ABC43253.1 odorant receptor [Danio rerio]|eukprot:NP_001243281.1 odorant receptor, family G, subfamily 106, member 3 [Danio rerio]